MKTAEEEEEEEEEDGKIVTFKRKKTLNTIRENLEYDITL